MNGEAPHFGCSGWEGVLLTLLGCFDITEYPHPVGVEGVLLDEEELDEDEELLDDLLNGSLLLRWPHFLSAGLPSSPTCLPVPYCSQVFSFGCEIEGFEGAESVDLTLLAPVI